MYEFDDIVLTEGTAAPPPPQQPASLTIVKQVVGDVPANEWSFSGTGGVGAFTLPAAGGTQTFSGLTPGSFTVSETAVSGYAAAASCTNGASGTGRVTVSLGSGANVTCTFVNTQVPPASLTIVKEVVGEIPAADWSFSGDLGAFTLPAAGGQQTFSALPAGGYEVTETAVSGYRTAVSCTNGASGARSVTVALAGQDVTCTFVNTEDTGGACSPPVAGNLIANPGFESGGAGWRFYTNQAASFSVVSTPDAGVEPYECSSNARVAIGVPGTNVQVYQKGFALKPNTTYTLRLAARSSGGEDIQLYVQRDSSPYTNYGLNRSARPAGAVCPAQHQPARLASRRLCAAARAGENLPARRPDRRHQRAAASQNGHAHLQWQTGWQDTTRWRSTESTPSLVQHQHRWRQNVEYRPGGPDLWNTVSEAWFGQSPTGTQLYIYNDGPAFSRMAHALQGQARQWHVERGKDVLRRRHPQLLPDPDRNRARRVPCCAGQR